MGRYRRGRIWWIDYYYQGRRIREAIGTSKALAEKVLKKRETEIADGKFFNIHKEAKIKFYEMSRLYLESYSKVNKRSWKRDVSSIKSLNTFFNSRLLKNIGSLDAENYKLERAGKVTPASINRELTCLKHIFTKAAEWNKVKENPLAKVKLLREDNKRLRYLTKEEINKLIEACPEHLKPIVILALFTGMRKGEILNLKWIDINFTEKNITLLQTKNDEPRTVFMSDIVYKTMLGIKRNSDIPYVFFNRQGKPYRVDMRKSFQTALKKVGITDFRFHDLRHTYASQLVLAGVDLYSVQKLLGHKSIQMTQRYAHLSPGQQRAALEKLNNQMVTNWSQTGVLGKTAKKEETVK